MTNGSDKHHGPVGKKKAAGKAKAKPKSPQAALKRRNLLPAGLAGARKG